MFTFLNKVQEPYVIETELNSYEFLKKLTEQYGKEIQTRVFVLEGINMKTWEALFVEFQKVMKFPEYFGHNLGAFEECMRDLYEWIEDTNEYILFIKNSSSILITENNKHKEKSILIDSFNFIGEELSKPIVELYHNDVNARKAYPFHVILSENM